MFFSNDQVSLDLLGVFRIRRNSVKRTSIENRNYDSISIRLSGCGHFVTENEKYSVKKGDLLYIPMTASYSQSTSGEGVIAIHFINYTANRSNKIEKITMSNTEEIENIILEMYRIWTEKKQGYKYKCTSLLYNILYMTNNQNSVHSQNTSSSIKEAVNYIHTHFRNGDLSVSSLASMSAMSETYFRKIFKKTYSMSPSQYIINLRLEYSSQLLQSHLYSISEVSEKSGFNDVKYFSRIFKKTFGLSPSKYKFSDIEKSLE